MSLTKNKNILLVLLNPFCSVKRLGSSGAPIWLAHLSWFRTDALCGRGRGCMRVSVEGNFFFPDFVRYSPIQSDSVRNGPKQDPNRSIWAKILVKKKNLKIRSKHTVLSADFKGKTLKSSQFSLLSIITLKLVYVYHYMKKKMLSNM